MIVFFSNQTFGVGNTKLADTPSEIAPVDAAVQFPLCDSVGKIMINSDTISIASTNGGSMWRGSFCYLCEQLHDSLSRMKVTRVSVDLGTTIAPGGQADATADVTSDGTAIAVAGYSSGNPGVVPRLVRIEDGKVRVIVVNVSESTVTLYDPASVDVLVKQPSLSQLIKVKTLTGMTTGNGVLYTDLKNSKCVVVSASSSKLIDGEAVVCAPFVNEGNYGISCRSATYPHGDFKSMELSITVYYIELIA